MLSRVEHEKSFIISGPGNDLRKPAFIVIQCTVFCQKNDVGGNTEIEIKFLGQCSTNGKLIGSF